MICSRHGLLDVHQSTYLLDVVTGEPGIPDSVAHKLIGQTMQPEYFMLEELYKLNSISLSATTRCVHHFAELVTKHHDSSVTLFGLRQGGDQVYTDTPPSPVRYW